MQKSVIPVRPFIVHFRGSGYGMVVPTKNKHNIHIYKIL